MQIEVAIKSPSKKNTLASVAVRLTFDEGRQITINDFRVLTNKQGEPWVAVPSFAVQNGKSFEYHRTVNFDKTSLREITETVLEKYQDRISKYGEVPASETSDELLFQGDV